MSGQTSKQSVVQPFGRLMTDGLIGGAIGAVINLVIYAIVINLAGPLMVVPQPGMALQPIPWFMVIVASVVPGLVAGLVLGGLQRLSASGTRIFLIIAGAFTLFSMIGPFVQAEGVVTISTLVVMHLVAAGAIVWALTMRNR